MVGEKFEIYFSQMAKNAFKLSTMVGESFEIYLFQKVPRVFPELSQNREKLPEFSLSFLKNRSFSRFSQSRRYHARPCAVLLYYLHRLPEIWIYVFIRWTYLINSSLILYATTQNQPIWCHSKIAEKSHLPTFTYQILVIQAASFFYYQNWVLMLCKNKQSRNRIRVY